MNVPDTVTEHRRRAQALVGAGRLGEALASLLTAADDLSTDDPSAGARLRVEAVQFGLMLDGGDRALALAQEAVEASDGANPAVRAMSLTRLGDALAWVGRHSEARRRWAEAVSIEAPHDPALACERANAALRSGELEAARDLAYEAVVRAREAESRDDLIDALTIATMAEIHLGSLREAGAVADQVLAMTSDEDGIIRTSAIGLAAWVAALVGDAERCGALIDEAAALLAQLGVTAPGGFAAGMLALSEARYGDAVVAFQSKTAEMRLSPVAQALGIRPFVHALAEAYARAGRGTDADELLATFFDACIATGQPRHAASALRTKGVVRDELAAFDAALEAHASWRNRFEEARTLLARGELLRRRGRREAARHDLRAAAERFSQVGAVIWHERAVTELRAAGERIAAVATPRGIGPERLTQQEAAVATLVTEGLSNREIAGRLYLSVKTVEGHLTTIYAKLGLRSRSQLIAAGIGRNDGRATSAD